MESIVKSTAPAVKRQPRVVSKEQALSVFESGVSYMLSAGWKLTFETHVDPATGVPTTKIEIVECMFSVDAEGMGALDAYTPSATNVPNVAAPCAVVA